MKFFGKFVGYMMAGLIVVGGFAALPDSLGPIGGILSAGLLVFAGWAMNHYANLTTQEDDASFVDMGLAIAMAALVNDLLRSNGQLTLMGTLPTILLVMAGAATGGALAAIFERDLLKR